MYLLNRPGSCRWRGSTCNIGAYLSDAKALDCDSEKAELIVFTPGYKQLIIKLTRLYPKVIFYQKDLSYNKLMLYFIWFWFGLKMTPGKRR